MSGYSNFKTKLVTVRVPEALVDDFDEALVRRGKNEDRSMVIRRMMEQVINATPKEQS